MKAGSFILNGVSSEDIQTVIQTRPALAAPRRRVTFKQGLGQDGSIPFDEESYDNTELTLALFTQGLSASKRREEIYALLNSNRYMDLILYSDQTKIYKVMVSEPPSFDSRYFMGEGQAYQVVFTVLPYKHLVDSPLKIMTTSGTITNPTLYPSKPRVAIYGSGNISLTIAGKTFILKGVDGNIVLDSEMEYAFKANKSGAYYDLKKLPYEATGIINENHKATTRVYPTFSPGVNSINWTGTVTRVDILPIWRTLT